MLLAYAQIAYASSIGSDLTILSRMSSTASIPPLRHRYMSIKMAYNRSCSSLVAMKKGHGKTRILVTTAEFSKAFEALVSDWRI